MYGGILVHDQNGTQRDDVEHTGSMHVVAAPDKFKGTATAIEIASAIALGAQSVDATCSQVPMADGGEGTLIAFGGPNRTSVVSGPFGDPVTAEWRLDRGIAIIEIAEVVGLVLAGGGPSNLPLDAGTRGVGELLDEAIDLGATSIIVGVGGSASTDGGLGAIEAVGSRERIRKVSVTVACDVRTPFLDAASRFGPQKGASPAQVNFLTRRLEALADQYIERSGVDVRVLPRAGAAGGLAGGLATLGADLVDGFDIIAAELGLEDQIAAADVVITGEGFLDAESYEGKVVGGVISMAMEFGVDVLVVAGQVCDKAQHPIEAVALADRFGIERALAKPTACVTDAVATHLRAG